MKHYTKWTIVMLRVLFEEFKVVHIILATFFSLLSAKTWGGGRRCSHCSPPTQLSGILRDWFLFYDLFLGLSKPNISRLKFFHWVFTCCQNDTEKKKEQTSGQSFVNAIINIWMPEINSMIHLKISFEYSR